MTAISQLQMSYSPEEDRILLRLNTTANQEFRFWLTRRYSLLLAQALRAHRAADPDVTTQATDQARKAIEEFKQEAADAEGNFAEAFRPSSEFPLGQDPVVAYKLSYKVTKGKLALTIQPKNGQGVTLVLDSQLNFNVTRLLKSSNETAEWGIDLEAEAPTEAPVESRIVN